MSDLISRQAAIYIASGYCHPANVAKELAELPSANVDLIKKIEEGIKATGTADEYSVGMCNGMKWCKSLLDGKEPVYYAVQPKLTHDTVQPEITHEQAIDYLHKTGWLQNHDRILTESKVPLKGIWRNYTDEGYVECPFCKSATNCESKEDIDELHFCFSCGAMLKRGEAE
jgi:hypothetical protein